MLPVFSCYKVAMKVKVESEKVGLKLNIQKTNIMASSPITSWQIDGETVETVSDFIFEGLQNHYRWWERLHFHFHALEREMETHSNVLAWRIPGTGEPGGLLSMGSHRVRHD